MRALSNGTGFAPWLPVPISSAFAAPVHQDREELTPTQAGESIAWGCFWKECPRERTKAGIP